MKKVLLSNWLNHDCKLSTETQKETVPNNKTSTNLVVEALTVDTKYTCKVQSHQEYSFTSTIEVNGINFQFRLIKLDSF